MKFYLVFFCLISCSSQNYTDPEREKLTFYLCDKKHTIAVKHSDDYESVVIRYNENQHVTLHHFVTAEGTGYSTHNLLWLTQGKKGMMVEKLDDGTEKIMFKECIAQKY